MISGIQLPNLDDVLSAHVLHDGFKALMAGVAKKQTMSCVVYGGNIYNFDFFAHAVGGDFESAVTNLESKGSGGLLSILLSHYLSTRPFYRLFAHNYVSLDEPFPSIGAASAKELQTFLDQCTSMPLNLLIAKAEKFDSITSASVAIADISDGDAWLLVFGEE